MNSIQIAATVHDVGIRHMDQYFGAWLMDPDKLNALLQQAQATNWHEHVAAVSAVKPQDIGEYEISGDGVAVIDVLGTMTKYGSSFSAMRNGTIGLRRAVRDAARDSKVKGVLLRIDSPGGSVAGTGDLGEEISRAKAVKPVVAYIEDLGASGAYWIASQATRVVTNPTALVGSIGVYTVLYDWSAAAARDGVKVMVVRSGEMKGAGTPGTEVTPAQLADAQRVIDQIHEQFIQVIMRGRNMSREQAIELADGRVHIASAALSLGLIDEIGDMESAISIAANKKPSRMKTGAANIQEAIKMADREDAPVIKPATIQEIEAHCKGCDEAFVVSQLKASATVPQVQAAWTEVLAQRVANAEAKAADLEKKNADLAAKTPAPGNDPVGDGKPGAPKAESGDVIAQFDEACAVHMKAGKTKQQAIRAVAIENKELHAAYIRAYNQNVGRAV